jgi:hypothetical protein
MAPEKYKNKNWQVLENVYNSSACQPLKPLAAANQAVFFFVMGPILFIIIGILTYYFQKIIRNIIAYY